MTAAPSLFDDEHPTEPIQLGGAPPLDWWVIATTKDEAYRRIIAAMCPSRVCRQCGEPSRRITEVSYDPNDPSAWGGRAGWSGPRPSSEQQLSSDRTATAQDTGVNPSIFAHGRAAKIVNTVGFSDCSHDDWRPGVWLDPFNPEGVL